MRPSPRRLVPACLATVLLGLSTLVVVSLPAASGAVPTGVGPAAASSAPAAAPARSAAPAGRRPARCGSDGPYVWRHLRRCGWPARSSTGPRPGACPHGLRRLGHDPRGVVRLTRTGQVLRCRSVVGCVEVAATGVRLLDVAVRCTSGRRGEAANGTGVVEVEQGASASLRRVRLRGMRGNHACVWHMGRSVQVVKVDCAGVDDGVFSWTAGRGAGDHTTIRHSLFHGFTTRTANGHVDGYQTEGASHGRIVHNTWLMTTDRGNQSNSAIAIWDSMDHSRDFLVARNLVAGGGFSVYAHDYSPSEADPRGGFAVTGIRFRGNVFSTHLFPCVGSYGVWFPRGAPTDRWDRRGNRVLESRQDVDRGNPTAAGRPCT